jgi:8-oxo-dGTP diphosphatase
VARLSLTYHQTAMDNDPVVKVTAAIIIEKDRVLITRRPPGGRHPGAWEFPGGKVEPGETPSECLARELSEELGIVVRVEEKLAEVEHAYPDLRVDLMVYSCDITAGSLSDLGCAEHAWVALEELDKYDLLPPDREVAEWLVRKGQSE